MWPYIATLLPTIGLLYLFYVIIKHIVEGDRRERRAHAEWERRQDELATKHSEGNSSTRHS